MKLDPTNSEAINELAEVQIQMLRKKGFTRHQAGTAIKLAEDLQVCLLFPFSGQSKVNVSAFTMFFLLNYSVGGGENFEVWCNSIKRLRNLYIRR